MTAPTDVTLREISVEALKKAGYNDPVSEQSALVTRAEDMWMREIKNDISYKCREFNALMTDSVITLTSGRARYDLPTDFKRLISITLLDGSTTGTAQTGASGSITLASTDTSGSEIEGREILLTGGTGANQISQIYSYNTSTKIASVYPAWTTSPSSDTTYRIIDDYRMLEEHPVTEYDKESYKYRKEKPSAYYPIGDADDGEFLLVQAPDDTYGVKMRYYADLERIDLSGTLMSTLYRKWQNVWVTGIWYRALVHQDDVNTAGAIQIYERELTDLVLRERYGNDLSNLQIRIEEQIA